MFIAILSSSLFVTAVVQCKPQASRFLSDRTVVDITCSACAQRLEAEPQLCCKCIDENASCNNDIATNFNRTTTGATCINELDCSNFGDCSCDITLDLRQDYDEFDNDVDTTCPIGQKNCCDPIDNQMFSSNLELAQVVGPRSKDRDVCMSQNLVATQDFSKGVVCGKRDSRVYYDAELPESFTNPGEWPWAVLIYDGDKYVAAGALVDNGVVVTVAHKMRDYVFRSDKLTVRVGDWNPNTRDIKEDFPEVGMTVDCVRLHPDADLDDTLANNVAVLKLGELAELNNDPISNVASVIELKSGLDRIERPGNRPEGVDKFKKIETKSSPLDIRLGLVTKDRGADPLGNEARSSELNIVDSYINTICLPRDQEQFKNYKGRCWVASWGTNLDRQREVDLPILTTDECVRALRPTFEARNVPNWTPKPSEICAGGERDKDTCRGEGGAPLVCYDEGYDQFYLLGLVGYGFECNQGQPGVYTNMADPGVQRFVYSALGDNNSFCDRK